jgi:flagellar motor switch protein FliN
MSSTFISDRDASFGGRSFRRPGSAMFPQSYEPIDDVPLVLSAELDRRAITFEELLKLEIDSVISLGRPSGENIDLYVGELLLGSGEILVVDGRLALRVADLRDKPTAAKRSEGEGASQNLQTMAVTE